MLEVSNRKIKIKDNLRLLPELPAPQPFSSSGAIKLNLNESEYPPETAELSVARSRDKNRSNLPKVLPGRGFPVVIPRTKYTKSRFNQGHGRTGR